MLNFFSSKTYLRLSLLYVIAVNASYSQKFIKLTVDNGLSQNSVNCVIQDSSGFLWFGTNDGLNRYDGYDIITYRYNTQDSSSISHNWIQSFCLDEYGQLWIGTRGGLNKWNDISQTFERHGYEKGTQYTSYDNDILSMCRDPKNKDCIWLGTSNGLKCYNTKELKYSHYANLISDNKSAYNNSVRGLDVDNNGIVWFGTGSGFYKFDSKANTVKQILAEAVNAVRIDHTQNIWVGTVKAGLYSYEYHTSDLVETRHIDQKSKFGLSHNGIWAIYEDRLHNLWIGTVGAGLNKINAKRDGKIDIYTNDAYNPYSLSNNEVHSIQQDRSGNIWFGTWGGGVNKLNVNAGKIKIFLPEEDIKKELINIFSVYEDAEENLWMGTASSGLFYYNIHTHQLTKYSYEPGKRNQVNGNYVILLYEDNNKNLWIGTTSGGLDKYDPKTKQFTNYQHKPGDTTSLSYNCVQAALETRDGRFWIGTYGGGLCEFDRSNGTFRSYRYNEKDNQSISSDVVQYLYEDSDQNLWIATISGLNLFDKKNLTFKRYSCIPENFFSLGGDYVYHIYPHKDKSKLWLATAGGLYLFDKESGKYTCYDDKAGLPNNNVYGILEDDHGNLWMSTNKGISCFNINQGTFKNFDQEDGLQNNEFNQGAFFKNRKGFMMFGGIRALNIFHPDSIVHNMIDPSIVFTSFKILNKETGYNLNHLNELVLSYEDAVISFDFAALDFTNPQKNMYAYLMQGFDQDWIYTDAKRRFATYTNLDPGEYVFHIKGTNSDGIWPSKARSIKIIITPPFWKTWWFVIIVSCVVLLTVYGALRYRFWQLLEIERLRTRIAAELHDNIGTGLTEISILSELGVQQNKELQGKALEIFTKIGENARYLGQNISDVVWLVSPQYTTVGDVLLQLKKSYDEIMFHKNISTICPPAHLWNDVQLSLEHRRHIYLLMKEAINNSLKHSFCKKIELQFFLHNDIMEVIYMDDGVGFDYSTVEKGNGLRNIEVRSKLMGGSAVISSKPGNGVKIVIHIPRV